MSHWLAALSEGPAPPLGTVVHIGAGSGGVLDHYASLQVRRAVLVEGDPETATRLRAATRRLGWAEAVECVVAAADGATTWHVFNLPRFNGPVVPAGLPARYPRLRQRAERTVQVVALASLPVLAESRSGDAPDVLVLDVPGQERPLLDALDDAALHRFAWILVRGCALDGADSGANELADRLAARCYRPLRLRDAGDPLWPVQLFRLDATQVRIERERRLNEGLRTRVETLQGEVDRLMHERMQLAEADVRARAALRAERDAQAERLEALEAQARRLATLEAEHRALSQAFNTLTGAHERLRGTAQAQADEAEALRAQLDTTARRVAELEAGRRDADLRQAMVQEELARAEAQLDTIKDLLLRESAP
jgi:FkbM family methyltransferase